MNRDQILSMLKMQDALNKIINPDWLNANFQWHRAIMDEGAEIMNHIGWKWWKAQTPTDNAQVKIEIVDLWHFFMSMILENCSGNYEDAADTIIEAFGSTGEPNTEVPVLVIVDAIIGAAASQRAVSVNAYNDLRARFDLSWEELYATYMAKNVLNLFRQANGYKDGSYTKLWDGVEDNEVLGAYLKRKPGATEDEIKDELNTQYKKVILNSFNAAQYIESSTVH